jgi:hypothetical protein
VALFERRRGSSEPILDRRRTYVDIMERVLGVGVFAEQPPGPGRFARVIPLSGAPSTAITAVEVQMIESEEP